MRKLRMGLAACLWAVLGLAGLFGLQYVGLLYFGFFAPRFEEVRRQTFEGSTAYNHGMIRDLQNLRMSYLTASPEAKAALRATILHRFAAYPSDKLPVELRAFYLQLQNGN